MPDPESYAEAMRPPLTLSVVQPGCVPLDVGANADIHARFIRAAGARLVVFPELSLTGYELDAPAVDLDDRRMIPVIKACAETGAIALVGAPIGGDIGRSHIATLAIDGRGVSVAYRKMWLGADESRRFTPGEKPAMIEVDDWRLGLAICKDTGIARHQQDTAALGIDIYVAGTAMFPAETDEQNARALRTAMAHKVWVAVASFAGPTGSGYTETAGSSAVWDPTGKVVAQVGREPGQSATATLSQRRP
ncbi:MAG: carbon-nitrogen hydrolase family protein [Pseudonocardiales bacterium]|nr:carbon-nitrogen hydrolase family protein [Pseudonocardiales bacterium]